MYISPPFSAQKFGQNILFLSQNILYVIRVIFFYTIWQAKIRLGQMSPIGKTLFAYNPPHFLFTGKVNNNICVFECCLFPRKKKNACDGITWLTHHHLE